MGTKSSRFGNAGLAPYTEDDEATTTWSAPCRRAASNTIIVPVALTSWVAIGSVRERGTEGRAAKCTTASVPSITPSRSSALRMEPSTTFTEGAFARFSRDPVEKSSRTTTWSTNSSAASVRQRFVPMKPAPPVTTTFTAGAKHSQWFDSRSPDPVSGIEHVPRTLADHVVVELVVIRHHHHCIGVLHLIRGRFDLEEWRGLG